MSVAEGEYLRVGVQKKLTAGTRGKFHGGLEGAYLQAQREDVLWYRSTEVPRIATSGSFQRRTRVEDTRERLESISDRTHSLY